MGKSQKKIEALAQRFAALGAPDPRSWAESEIEEGIPQLARYLFLRQAWRQVVAEDDPSWIAAEIEAALDEPDAPFAGAGLALARLRALGASDADLTDLVRAMQAQLLSGLAYLLDDASLDDEPAAEGVSWMLCQLTDEGPVSMDGLHESVLETDPTGSEMRPEMTDPSPPPELLRRQRIFRRGLRVLVFCEAASVVAYYTEVVRPGIAFAFLLIAVVASVGWFIWGIRWIETARLTVVLDAEQEAVLTRKRDRFVRRAGVLGFGLLWGTMMAVTDSWDALTTEPVSLSARRLIGQLVLHVPLGLLLGYFWGRVMWRVAPVWTTSADAKPRA